uniref:PHD-type domain-containing protein n=2 Tax=Babesia bovis TaxID=5865 RepID=A7ANV3_BABBO|eukprot:XP_001611805.1 hypothetical protein [Babesia bovis T2Bo]
MHIRRSHVIREENASSYCRYQNEVANILRMTSAVTASAMMADGGAPTDAAATNLDMHIEPCVALPSEIEFHVGADAEPDEHSLDEWRQYFLEPRDTEACDSEVPQLIPTVTDEIDINMEINTNVEYDVLPVVEMHTGQGDMGADSNNSQFRGQRMIWQKSDVFRPIPYGPASDILMENQDQPTRKRSLEECPNLETTVLAGSDFLEPRDLSDMFLQQILYSCGGIVALLDAVKQNLDREVQGNGKSASDKKYARFHILVDTGRTAGFVVLRISKWLLEVIHDDHVLAQRSDKAPVSAVSIALDEEVRHFLSHVNAESNRNVSSAHSYFGNTLTRNVDLMSGFGEYGLKEDIRSLHAAANVSYSDADTLRLRKKLVKRAKNEQSLKSVELEDFIILSPLESELLRRCAFEMSHVNDTNIKLAVVKHTMEASDDIPSLLMVDWNSILSKIKASAAVTHSKNGQKGSNSKSTQTNVKNERPVNKTPVTPKSQQPSLEQSNSLGNLPPVPMVHLGKHTWPVVDDMNFVKGQKEITERDLTVVSSQLRTIRENIRENVLELNARLPTINERHGYADTLLEQYESTERWATVVNNFCKGLNDSTDNKTPTIYTHKSAAPVVLATSASEARAAAMKAEGIAEGAYCSVCFINTGNNLNPILTCSRCFMSAHRNCYGVSRNMKPAYAVDYVCRRCEYERRGMGSHWQTAFRSCSVVCAICGRGGGALKRCETDEWAHVFCLLALLPETRCINFVHMEPWSIQGIAAWRRDVICTVCGVDWGYVMGCSDCSAAAHPLCAWLHGFKFMPSAAMVYRAYLSRGHGLTRDLRVRLQCNGHDPERQWHVFISTRNKRFVNRDSAAYLFEGRDKRKKSRALVIEGMASMESLDLVDIRSTLCDTKQFMTDRRCAVCFGGGGTIATCSHCDRMAHYSCYVENDRDSITTDLGWGPLEFICDPCRNNDEEALCGICSQNVGLLKQVPTENNQRLYIHTICGVCFPRVLVSLYRGIPVDTTDTLPCTVCNSVDGMLLQCCQEGCSTMFHAYCGLESRYVVEAHCIDISRGPQYVAFCQQHALVSRSVGTNLKLLLRLRIYLQMLRALTTDMASQDAVVRAWRRKRQELLNLECPLTALINTRFDNSHE